MDLKQRMQESQENRKLVEEDMSTALMNGKNVLIKSLPGMGRLASVKAAATKAGLTLFEMDLSTGLSGLPVRVEKQTEADVQKIEKFIVDSVERSKANAILLDTFPKDDITAFANVASKFNIPLIVSVPHNDTYDDKLSISVFDTPKEIKSIVDSMPLLETQDFNPKVPMPSAALLSRMRISFASDLDDSNKPKPK